MRRVLASILAIAVAIVLVGCAALQNSSGIRYVKLFDEHITFLDPQPATIKELVVHLRLPGEVKLSSVDSSTISLKTTKLFWNESFVINQNTNRYKIEQYLSGNRLNVHMRLYFCDLANIFESDASVKPGNVKYPRK